MDSKFGTFYDGEQHDNNYVTLPDHPTFSEQGDRLRDYDEEADFESVNLAAVRPGHWEFFTDSTEFYRWYEYGGNPRSEPLTREALSELLKHIPNAGGSNDAFTAAEWDHFKDRKLGKLRTPIETLQDIFAHTAKESWQATAREIADWCRTEKRPNVVDVHAALVGLIFRANRVAEADGVTLPAWYQQATNARNFIEATYHQEIERSLNTQRLGDAYARLREFHDAYRKALAENDTEQAAFERYEASQLERQFPVFNGLFFTEDIPTAKATKDDSESDSDLSF